jgi:hypothetical protein
VAHRVARPFDLHGVPADLDAPRKAAAQTEDRLEHLGAARADEARKAEHFARAHLEAQVFDPAGHDEAFDLQGDGASAGAHLVRKHVGQLAPDHQVGHLLTREPCASRRARRSGRRASRSPRR